VAGGNPIVDTLVKPMGIYRKASFEAVAVAEIPVLYRVARRLTLNDAWAEDLVGQTLLQAAKAWESFDGQFPRSWLIRILQNAYRHDVRRANRRPKEVAIEDHDAQGEDLWQELSGRIIEAHIYEELDKLPEEYRLAVSLCDVEELSYEEAGEAMGIPTGTVKSRLFRGRRLLRQRLATIQLGAE